MNGKVPVSGDVGAGFGVGVGTGIGRGAGIGAGAGPGVGAGASLASPPAEQLAEVLLTELVRTLTSGARSGTVLGGRPHLRLFGEAIDVALPLRALRRLGEVAPPSSLELDDATLQRHARAITDDEGYLVSPVGLHAGQGHGTDHGAAAPADALSLRLYTSPFSRPMNALLRADPSRPETWLRVVEGLRHAARRAGADGDRRTARLRESLEGLDRIDDPRLPRLLGEQLVHAFMAMRALLRQPRVQGGDERRLRLRCTLPDAVLADLRWLAASDDGWAWRDPGLLSTSPHTGRRWTHDADDPGEPDALEIRPRVHGSAGRRLDGSVDGVAGPEPLVVFPPGTPFEVVEVIEAPAPEGERGRVMARLLELPPRRAWVMR